MNHEPIYSKKSPPLGTVVLTGASGWVGKVICDMLSTDGTSVLRLQRNRMQNVASSGCFFADLTDPKSLAVAARRVHDQKIKADCLIHCAGVAHQPNETAEIADSMRLVNADGTANIIKFCKDTGIKRIVYVSSISPYQWSKDPKPVNEEATLSPCTAYAKSKLKGEELTKSSGLDWRITRLATVFGSGDKANFLKLSTALKRRRFIIPGNGSARKSLIPVDLAARLITKFASLDNPKHRLINLAEPEAPNLKEICDSFSNICEFPRAPSVPLILLKFLAKGGDLAGLIRPMPLNSTVIDKLTTSTWVDTQRMHEVFDSIPSSSFAAHLERHAEYYRNA